ncbi:MAG: hypothetical protein IJM55_04670 [Ruminococcus sp.]|nr:hypothetical protein [Ruminococcus sp.]
MRSTGLKKIVFMLFLAALGLGIAAAGFTDVKCLISGKTINVGDSEKKDYRDPAMAEGEVFFIQGPFATYEQTNTTFGIPTGKTSTNYYLALDMTRDDYIKAVKDGEMDLLYKGFYFVYAVSDEDKMKEADKAATECSDYFKKSMRTGDFSEVPDIHIKIEGKLMKQPDDSEYKRIRDDFFASGGLNSTEVADLMVRDGKLGIVNVLVFAGGVLLCIIPIVILIVSFIKRKKEESAAELW